MEKEIDLEFVRSRGFPLVRRSIGGGAILDGPWEQDYFIVVHRKSPRALNDPQNVRVYVDGARADSAKPSETGPGVDDTRMSRAEDERFPIPSPFRWTSPGSVTERINCPSQFPF